MVNVNDYISGRIIYNTKLALYSLKFVKTSIVGSWIGTKLFNRIRKFEPKLIDIEIASKLILV